MVDSSISTSFGMAVRKRRARCGLSQKQLAKLAGLHSTYVGMVERGARNVTLSVAVRLANALNIALPLLVEEALPEGRPGLKEPCLRCRPETQN